MTLPYFMDFRMIEATMRDEKCTMQKARDILYKLWKDRPDDNS